MTELTNSVISEGVGFIQAEAALCVWEYALEEKPVYDWLRGGEGAAQARTACIEIAYLVEIAYQTASGGDQSRMDRWLFDWDIVPVIMQGFRGRVPRGPEDITIEIAVEVGNITLMVMEGCAKYDQSRSQDSGTINLSG